MITVQNLEGNEQKNQKFRFQSVLGHITVAVACLGEPFKAGIVPRLGAILAGDYFCTEPRNHWRSLQAGQWRMSGGERSEHERLALKGRASSSIASARGCNSAGRNYGRLGLQPLAETVQTAKRNDRRLIPPSKPLLKTKVRGGLCSLTPSG